MSSPEPIPPPHRPPLLPGPLPGPPGGPLASPAAGDLSLPTDEQLRAGAAVDPLAETEKLTSGNPGEIVALGEDFLLAGGDMATAHQLSQQAQQWVGDSYLNDGTPVYDQATHVASLPGNLPDAAGQLNRIGGRLGEIAEALRTATGDAVERYNALFQTSLPATREQWRARVDAAKGPGGLIPFDVFDALVGERNRIASMMQQDVTELGNGIRDLVTSYEGELASGMTMLADIGYFAPEGLDAGPGGEGLTVEGAADAAAEDVRAAMALPPGDNGLAALDESLRTFTGIQERLERGEQLTADERAYATRFSEALGADGLTQLTRYAEESARAAIPPTVPPDRRDEMVATRYAGALAPLGTTFTAMAEPAPAQPGGPPVAGQASAANLPPAVQALLNTRVGVDGGRGTRYPNGGALDPDLSFVGGERDEAILSGVDGLDRVRAASDLFASSTVDPNAALATELASTAVQTKQDLNAIQDTTGWTLSFPGAQAPDAATQGRLDALVDDGVAGELLSTAARDHDSASAILQDDALRAPVLGLNWETAADGAAAVVANGTSRDPAVGGGGEAQARAAQAVVSEVATDPGGYANRMAAPVNDAVADMGGTYIDAFGASPVVQSGYEGGRADSIGRPMGPSFALTEGDNTNFLRYIAESGDQRAEDFQAQARLYNHADLTAAFRSGDTGAVDQAMRTAGRLDGALSQANVESRLGEVADADDRAAAEYQAAVLRERADNQVRNVLVVAGRELVNELPIASSVTAVGAEIAKGWNNYESAPPPGPTPGLPGATADVTAEANRSYAVNRDMLIAGAMQEAGVFAPDEAPAILTADADRDGHVDPPRTSSVHQDQLLSSVGVQLADRYGLSTQAHEDGRSQYYSVDGQLDGQAPAESRWSNSDELYYGSERPENTPLGNRETDPRVLDDPGYDPTARAR